MEQMTIAVHPVEISRAILWKRSGMYIEVVPGQQEIALKAAIAGIAEYNRNPAWLDPSVPAEGPSPRGKATSKKAALDNWPRSGSQRERILSAVVWAKAYGATREEIAGVTQLSGDTVRPRVLELIQGGWLFETEHTRPTRKGNDSVVLLASQKAVEFRA